MRTATFAIVFLLAITLAVAERNTAGLDVDARETEQTSNFGVLLDTGSDDEEENTAPHNLLESFAMREDDFEGAFVIVKTRNEFTIVELPPQVREPYLVGQDDEGLWIVGQIEVEDTTYGPVLKVKPKGFTEGVVFSDLIVTSYAPKESAGIEPDEIDFESDAKGIEPDEIDNKLTDEELAGLLLPAVQKVRAAQTDEEAIGLLLPAVQKLRGIEPDEIDFESDAKGIEPDEIDYAGDDQEGLLLPAVQKAQEEEGFFGRFLFWFR